MPASPIAIASNKSSRSSPTPFGESPIPFRWFDDLRTTQAVAPNA
jgi:hypothetical protein